MAKKNPIQNALDASKDVAQQAQDRLEALLREINRSTEEQASQVQATVQELVDRSRDNTERISDRIAKQVQTQLASLGLATKADIARLERKIDGLQKRASKTPTKKGTNSKAAKQAVAKKKSTKQA
jgi:polyhydroxyalkanoate synthesis regulator phasin